MPPFAPRRTFFNPKTAPVPGRYDKFMFALNLGTVYPYSFVMYNPNSDTITLDSLKEPVPLSLLIPTALSNGKAEDAKALSVRDCRLLQALLKAATEHEVHQHKKAHKLYQDHKKRCNNSFHCQMYWKGMASLATLLESGLRCAPCHSFSTCTLE